MRKHRENPYFETSSMLELKELLNEFTDEELKEMSTSISLRDGCCGDRMYLNTFGIRYHKHKDGHSLEVMSEDEIAGYRTCIQSGGTIERDKKYFSDKEAK